jgi:hypothetical protein
MLGLFSISNVQDRLRKSSFLLIATAFALSGLMPILLSSKVDAAQLTSRRVTISTSEQSATGVSYAFAFTLPSTTAVQSIRFEFCTNPLGTCTKPTGMDINYTLTTLNATQTFSEATAFTEYTGADAGACDDHNNGTPANSTEYCVTRTDTDAETAAAKAITIDNVTNPSTTSIDDLFVRISLYSDASFGTEVHTGTVAAAITDQLTVTGRVQERLQFCVSAVADDDAADTTINGLTDVAGCAALTDTSVDIGVVDNDSVSLAPVNNNTTELGEDTLGIAMINTNASAGTALTFFVDPVVAGTSALAGETHQLYSFRVYGSSIDCNATVATFTDQCFRSASNSGEGTVVNPANEWFGMYVPCVDTDEGAVATPMTVSDVFDGADEVTTNADDCENEDKDDIDANGSQNLGWISETGTTESLATSSNVLDDAIVKLSFGAAAAGTTPTGTYTVVTTYIATPTF